MSKKITGYGSLVILLFSILVDLDSENCYEETYEFCVFEKIRADEMGVSFMKNAWETLERLRDRLLAFLNIIMMANMLLALNKTEDN